MERSLTPRRLLGLGLALALAVAAMAAAPARAQNASVPGTLELYPTFEAVGARLTYAGDADGDATARLEWRAAGAATWTPGLAMTRITNARWAASVLWLSPGTDYEVRAVITDPDGGGSASGRVTTRREPVRTVSGRTWWVAIGGSDSAAGGATTPLRTLQHAADLAQPGDEIRLRPGVYLQGLDTPRSGTAAAPIIVVADAPGVVIDGADPAYLRRTDWRSEGGGIWSVPFASATKLVAVDSLMRLYRQADLASLQSNANGMTQGWTLSGGRLYVKPEGGVSPIGRVVSVARINVGLYVDESYWWFEGLEVRHFGTTTGGSGMRIRAGNGCVVRNNHFHTNGGRGIFMNVGSADNLVEGNLVRDPRIGGWPWSATKAHEEEIAGISNRGGRGNVVRFNTIDGLFDGMDASDGDLDENVAADGDFQGNLVRGVGDDGIETDLVSGINLRLWHNRFHANFSGISVAPNYQGPEYIVYNTLTETRRSAFKFSLDGTGQTYILHNTVWSSVSGAPAVKPSGGYSNIHFRNNVLVSTAAPVVSDDAGESVTGNDYDGDLMHTPGSSVLFRWKGASYSTLAALRSGTGFEMVGRTGDPLFVSTAAGDFNLSPGSPGIDAAPRIPGVNDTFAGSGPDVGAWESGLTAPDAIPPARITDLTAEP